MDTNRISRLSGKLQLNTVDISHHEEHEDHKGETHHLQDVHFAHFAEVMAVNGKGNGQWQQFPAL
ncbi:MAG: hypothetical protein PVF31_11985, partial [Desulfobacterales bacterium]